MSRFMRSETAIRPALAWRLCAALLVWASVGGCVTVVRAAGEVDEEHIKAAFICNFAKFTQWPDSKRGPLIVGVVGRGSVNNVLKVIARANVVAGREMVVREVGKHDDLGALHILFIPASEERRGTVILARVSGTAVLTVGESEHFLRDGGIVQLYIRDNRVRFQINADAASKAGLKISSQLLSLAKP